MDGSWYVGRDGVRSGPFTTTELRRMVASGQVAGGDLLWSEGMPAWAPCSAVQGLLGGPPAGVPANPYAAPSSSRGPSAGGGLPVVPGAGARLQGRRYSFGDAFDVATKTFSTHWGHLVLVGLIVLAGFVLAAVPQWAVQIIGVVSGDSVLMKATRVMGMCIGWIINILVGGHLGSGFVLAGANAVAGRPQLSDVFLGFKRYGRVLLAHLLMLSCWLGVFVVAYLPFIVCVVITALVGNQIRGVFALLVVLGALVSFGLAVAGMVLVGVRVFFAATIVADPQLGSMGVMEGFRLSWATVTPERAFSLFGLMFVVILLMGLSCLLLCVPYLLAGLPFLLAAYGAAYALLFRCDPARAPDVR